MKRRTAALGVLVVASLALVPACSQSDGQGSASGTLNLPNCWSGPFDLAPDFFTAAPYQDRSLILRIQNGGDFQSFSDGISILVDDVGAVRNQLKAPGSGGMVELDVGLLPGVTPPGVPIVPDTHPAPVSGSLYLQRTCRTQNVALYATKRADIGSTTACGGPTPTNCAGWPEPTTESDGRVTGHSRIRFSQLFNGQIDESLASERLIEGSFSFYLVDPRELTPATPDVPPPCRGRICGTFHFYFQRGRPGQAFP